MGKADNDLINAAMDAAEEQIGGVDESTVETAPEPEAAPEIEEKEEIEPEAEDSETLEASEEEQIPDNEAKAETVETEEGQTQEATQSEVIAAPAILSAETKALWNKIPADVQKALSQDALRTQQQLSRLANESQRGKQWETRVNSDFQTKEDLDAHRAMLKLKGIQDEVGELHNYRAWNKLFRHDTVLGIQSLMQEHGVTLEELSGETLSEDQERYANDPRLDALIEDFKKEREARESEKKEAEQHTLRTKIDAWKATPDKYGKPKGEFCQLYAPQIDQEWQIVLNEAGENGENLSFEDSLNRAHERVQERIFKAHGINPNMPKPKTVEQRQAQTAKVQSAMVKASGAPRSETITKKARPEYKNDKERVDAAMKRAEAKLSAR